MQRLATSVSNAIEIRGYAVFLIVRGGLAYLKLAGIVNLGVNDVSQFTSFHAASRFRNMLEKLKYQNNGFKL